MNEPLISVIVPVYNVEQYLRQCVDSILAQTHTNLEVILVDDGSPDNCGAICDEYAAHDARVVVIHKENGGLSDARNAGLDIAKGEYIGFVDSDDWIESDMYESMLCNMVDNNCDIAICGFAAYGTDCTIPHNPNIEQGVASPEQAIVDSLTGIKYTVSACSKLYKKSVFASIRYPYGRIYEDAFVIVDVLAQASQVAFDTTTKYYYRRRAASIVNVAGNMKSFVDSIDAFHAVSDAILQHYPQQSDFARSILLTNYYSLVYSAHNIPNCTKAREYREIVSVLKHSLGFVLASNHFTTKAKIKAVALKLNVHLYRLIIIVNLKTKKKYLVDAFQ